MNRQDVLTVGEAARWLRVDPASIEREIAAGNIRAVKIDGHTRIARGVVEDYLGLRSRVTASRRWGVVAAVAAIALTGTAVSMDFPFPLWDDAVEITPQVAEFVDPVTLPESDPSRYGLVNAPLDYRRYNEAPNQAGSGATHMLMSLQMQNDLPPGSLSFPWTQYVQLDTNHDLGDGVVSHLRLHNRGEGWSTAAHTDAFAWGTGTTLGNNIELLDIGGTAYTVAMNIQNKAWRADVGMQIQTGPLPATHPLFVPGMDGSWEAGIRLSGHEGGGYYKTGIDFDPFTQGQRGIWMRGDFDIGLDLGTNELSMQNGTKLTLGAGSGVAMRFNANRGRIEFLQNDVVVAFLNINERSVNLAN